MNQGWYHCGRCGSFFKSDIGLQNERLCAECGLRPDTGTWPIHRDRLPQSERSLATFDRTGDASLDSGQRAVRKKRKKSLMFKFLGCWVVGMCLLIWIRTYDNQKKIGEDTGSHKEGIKFVEGTMADERIALLSQAMPECHRALVGFLTAGAPESRNQFVADPIGTAGSMASFYKYNAFPSLEVTDLKRTGQQVLKVGDEWMIETRWSDGKGLELDAVFRRYGAVWKLDWQHFSRYGEYSWPLFLAGEGPDEAEFRLLARKVGDGVKAEDSGSRLRFTLLSPVFGKSAEIGMESSELVVNRHSDEGLKLDAAFDAKKSGRSIFGGTLPQMEPEHWVRVRVRIKRSEFAGVRSFALQEVIACHWLGSEEPGFELKKLKGNPF